MGKRETDRQTEKGGGGGGGGQNKKNKEIQRERLKTRLMAVQDKNKNEKKKKKNLISFVVTRQSQELFSPVSRSLVTTTDNSKMRCYSELQSLVILKALCLSAQNLIVKTLISKRKSFARMRLVECCLYCGSPLLTEDCRNWVVFVVVVVVFSM